MPLALFMCAAPWSAAAAPALGTASLLFDGERIYAELSFVRPDGTRHETLTFVDLGGPSMVVSAELMQELQLDRRPATLEVGAMPIRVEPRAISSDPWLPHFVGAHRKVEAVLPAVVLQSYQLLIDYRRRTLTVAQPGTLRLTGVAIPATVDPATGLAAVDVSIDGHSYAVTLDAGSAYTWLGRSTVEGWLAVHPDWQRGTGAVGASNMRIESAGILLRIPEVRLGSLTLRDMGALAVGASKEIGDFMDWYSKKNARPVSGWLGGNVLQAFRLAIDYPNRMTYWQRQSRAESRGLDQVGLTLAREHGRYFVAAVVTRAGRPTVEGAQIGDQLLRIDALATAGASSSAVLAALHGRPGEMRHLVLARAHSTLRIDAPVTAF